MIILISGRDLTLLSLSAIAILRRDPIVLSPPGKATAAVDGRFLEEQAFRPRAISSRDSPIRYDQVSSRPGP